MVTVKNSNGYETFITAGSYELKADEPLESGGTGMGPTPYDLLLSALGACTAMTMRMYAERKKLSLEAMTITLNHDKIHAEDCENCETKVGKLDRIIIKISFTGNLSEDDKTKLMQISEKCPVHRTLTSEIKIESVMNES
ncbi:MAG: OsmC family protein [bacterium]|nr:OsmC family protein [bacterium]